MGDPPSDRRISRFVVVVSEIFKYGGIDVCWLATLIEVHYGRHLPQTVRGEADPRAPIRVSGPSIAIKCQVHIADRVAVLIGSLDLEGRRKPLDSDGLTHQFKRSLQSGILPVGRDGYDCRIANRAVSACDRYRVSSGTNLVETEVCLAENTGSVRDR